MIQFYTLASSSSGNAALLCTGASRLLIDAGISCIIQPGGSIRDQDSIDACNKYGIAMVFTGMRHFKH